MYLPSREHATIAPLFIQGRLAVVICMAKVKLPRIALSSRAYILAGSVLSSTQAKRLSQSGKLPAGIMTGADTAPAELSLEEWCEFK